MSIKNQHFGGTEPSELEKWCDGRVHPNAPEDDKKFAYEHQDAYEDISSDNYDDSGRPHLYRETTTMAYANEIAQKHKISLDDAKRLINIFAASGEYYFNLYSNEWQRSQFPLVNRITSGCKYDYYDRFD